MNSGSGFAHRLRRDGPAALIFAVCAHIIFFTFSTFIVPTPHTVALVLHQAPVPTLAIAGDDESKSADKKADEVENVDESQPTKASPPNGVVEVETTKQPVVPIETQPLPKALSTGATSSAANTVDALTFPEAARTGVPEGSGTSTLALQRSGEAKTAALKRNGGSPGTEDALLKGLYWLKSVQDLSDPKDRGYGSWDSDGFAKHYLTRGPNESDVAWGIRLEAEGRGSQFYDLGLTALCTLAFSGAGYGEDDPIFGTCVRAALNYILAQQDDEGCFLSPVRVRSGNMYDHALCVLALADASRLADDNRYLAPLRKGQAFLVSRQQNGGGWDYKAYKPAEERDRSDLSITGFCAMALSSCQSLGIPIPVACATRMRDFLRAMTTLDGAAMYADEGTGGMRLTQGMTAVNLFARRLLGEDSSSEMQQRMLERISKHPPSQADYSIDNDPYVWYYASLSLVIGGDDAWATYNNAFKQTLMDAQEKQSGPRRGSWPASWYYAKNHGGRVYATAMACLCLEVYYRYLPEYMRSQAAQHAAMWQDG